MQYRTSFQNLLSAAIFLIFCLGIAGCEGLFADLPEDEQQCTDERDCLNGEFCDDGVCADDPDSCTGADCENSADCEGEDCENHDQQFCEDNGMIWDEEAGECVDDSSNDGGCDTTEDCEETFSCIDGGCVLDDECGGECDPDAEYCYDAECRPRCENVDDCDGVAGIINGECKDIDNGENCTPDSAACACN